jgi:hypothetical protein
MLKWIRKFAAEHLAEERKILSFKALGCNKAQCKKIKKVAKDFEKHSGLTLEQALARIEGIYAYYGELEVENVSAMKHEKKEVVR